MIRAGGGDPAAGPAGPVDPNAERLIRWALLVAVCVCVASFGPPGLVPPTLSLLLHLAAVGSAAAASLRGERVPAPHLTGWDEAAASLALALLLGFLFPTDISASPPRGDG